ncbi:histone acetyltransferase GCN5-like protein [Xylariaceae sp. FL0255]|nr:histone acetyltransferase GCN5-like protein [Xylariaceae sp. FL0255]
MLQRQPAEVQEKSGQIEARVVANDGTDESIRTLVYLKCLFNTCLPAMKPAYISKIVLDYSHKSLVLIRRTTQDNGAVIGGITWREFPGNRVAELVFCAIEPGTTRQGYGAHLMNHVKDYFRASGPIMHLITCADNAAVNFFKKQGFTTDITLNPALWKGYIKDYNHTTLMHCEMVPHIKYLAASQMLHRQKQAILAKQREQRESGPDFKDMKTFLEKIQKNQFAWPFMNPVDEKLVIDYYDIVTHPMDLKTMEQKLNDDKYSWPEDLVEDIKLITANCRLYNKPETEYVRCADGLERYMWILIKQSKGWEGLLQDKEEKKQEKSKA